MLPSEQHRRRSRTVASALAAAALLAPTFARQSEPVRSVHRAQLEELGERAHPTSDDDAEAAADARRRARRQGPSAQRRASPTIDDDFVVFGYLQSETQVYHLRWHALTHVGSLFVGFDSLGHLTGTSAFTGRSPYLKAGGAAEAAGVRVVLVLASFDDASNGAIATVMTSPARRATLINELVNVLAADSYSHGVSLDLEFSWGANVRDGITAFTHELRAALDGLGPDYELSIYTNAIFSANQWNFNATTGITPAIDYMLYSMYDWASGSTAHAISDFDNCLGASRMHAYLNAGLPPEKFVPVVSAYSRRWNGVSVYNGVGSSPQSAGFTDALYDVTLNPAIGPNALRYVRGDEAGWYTWNDGTQRVRTFEALAGMEYELRHALSLQDPAGGWSGRRLGGVGFWSLMWMAEFTSIDPRTGASVARTRTYPHVYQLCHELFSPPGTRRLFLETFAGLDYRWRDPNESPDTRGDTDADSVRELVLAPVVGGGNALSVTYDFEGASGNRAVIAHEVLASPLAPTVADTNAVLGHVGPSTRLSATIATTVGQPNYSVRMLVIDAQRQVEASPPFSLGPTGVRTIAWDLTDALSVHAYSTSEPALASGDGILSTNAAGRADIGFYGFVIEGSGATRGTLVIDDIAYEDATPGGRAYRINELRYADDAFEFVELHGPAGPLPIGLVLRSYDASDGSVAASFPLIGAIPDDGGGFGFFVLGDPGVPNVDSTFGFSATRDDLANLDPSALQVVDSFIGQVYDSLVYEAFGGLDDLTRLEARGVTSNGWPWSGEVANGRDALGRPYALGRYPDGSDTGRNHADFSFQVSSPGAANGAALALPAAFDFEAPLTTGFQTFDVMRRVDPITAGIQRSNSGGLAWRCVDVAGGGVIGVLGDAALGGERPVVVTGEVYVPSSLAPAQAIAVGLCGSQGSNFFSSTAAARSGYESGYWLIYENRAGVQLDDGRADHPGVWELVHATHDNMDGAPVTLLASVTNQDVGVLQGKWIAFELALVPDLQSVGKLVVTLNGREVFHGDLPVGGPQRGAFQVGFRENHAGLPSASEGTWVDGLRFR